MFTALKRKTMMTQISLFNLFIFVLLITFIVGTYQIVSNIIVSELSNVQQEMFMKTRIKEMNTFLYHQERLITRFLTLNTNELISIHKLVMQLYDQPMEESDFEFDFQGRKEIPANLGYLAQGFQLSNSLFCGQTIQEPKVKKKEHTLANMIGHTVLLHQQVAKGESVIHGVLNFEPKIVFSHKCYRRGEPLFNSYKVEERQWYIDAVELYNQKKDEQKYQLQFTKPVVFFKTTIVGLGIYIPQVNKYNELTGVWVKTFLPQIFVKFLKQTENADMILLVDRSGIIIVHNITTDVPLIYFQNQTITGFNDEDWQSVKAGRVDQNTCIGNLKIPNQICKYNTVYQKDFHIVITGLSGFDLYLIIWYDIGPFQLQFDKENELIKYTIQKSMTDVIFQSVLIQIGITLTAIITFLILVTKPMNSIVYHIKAALSTQGTRHKIDFHKTSIFHSSQVQKLLKSFNYFMKKLVNSQLTKTPQCLLIEKFKYLRRVKVGYRNRLQRSCENLEDNRQDIYNN